MAARHVGASPRRSEDRAFLLGQGRFLEDLRLAGLLHAAVLRSPHAHARVCGIASEAARCLPGVVAVYTFDDFARALRPLPPLATPPPALAARLPIRLADAPQLPLARDLVRHVGEAVALVVAEDRYVAEDALALVEVEYEPLCAVTDVLEASGPGVPALHAGASDNVAFSFLGRVGDADAAFRDAAIVLREEFRIPRQAAMPLEPRGVAAAYERRDGTLTTWSGSQHPHYVQLALTDVLVS